MEEILLTADQLAARDLIGAWYIEGGFEKQVFVLAGYAGTGKTFLIDYIVEHTLGLSKEEVAFCTPTGKASSVLIQRGRLASTVHRLIYNAEEEEYEATVAGQLVRSHRIKFVKKNKIPGYKLIVLDEVSMVDSVMMEDLLSFGVPVLASGDIGQLPPVNGENKLIKNPDYVLKEIVRQSLDNPIIKLATMARNGIPIPYGNYGHVLVLDKRSLGDGHIKKLLLTADQVICGTNNTRRQLNDQIRAYKGIDTVKDPLPIPGDKVICTVNN
jgi:exodeoxyribonuclease V